MYEQSDRAFVIQLIEGLCQASRDVTKDVAMEKFKPSESMLVEDAIEPVFLASLTGIVLKRGTGTEIIKIGKEEDKQTNCSEVVKIPKIIFIVEDLTQSGVKIQSNLTLMACSQHVVKSLTVSQFLPFRNSCVHCMFQHYLNKI